MVLVGDLLQQFIRLPRFADRLPDERLHAEDGEGQEEPERRQDERASVWRAVAKTKPLAPTMRMCPEDAV